MASAASAPTAREATASTAAPTTHDAANYLRQLHGQLDAAAQAGDVAAAYDTVTTLRPVLDGVRQAPVERAAADLNSRADGQAAELERDLPGLDLLAPVSALVNSLLATVMDLVTSLLGGLPVPLPIPELPLPLPEVPGVPVPDLPAAPDAPAPPEAPAPPAEAPAPPADAALPEAPLPDAPLPAVPDAQLS